MSGSSLAEELSSHVVANTKTYLVDFAHKSATEKANFCKQMTQILLNNNRELYALAALRTANRLVPGDPNVVGLADHLERSREVAVPLASLCQPTFEVIRASEPSFARHAAAFEPRPISYCWAANGGLTKALSACSGPAIATDLSFILVRKGRPVAITRAQVKADSGVLDDREPVVIQAARGDCPNLSWQTINAALKVLHELALRCGAKDIQITDCEASVSRETQLERALFCHEYFLERRIALVVDLTQSVNAIWSDLRDSYRPLIRRQQERHTITYFTGERVSAESVAIWAEFAMRTTTDLSAADIASVAELCRQGGGEFGVACLPDGPPQAVTATIWDGDGALYFAGHYPADEAGKKCSHFMVWDAISRAKQRNHAKFYLTYFEDPPYRYVSGDLIATKSEKWHNVTHFKRGFTPIAEKRIVFRKAL